MTSPDHSAFVAAFQDAWARRDPAAFLALWHADGVLRYPFADRPIRGDEIGLLNEITNANAPRLTWKTLSWMSRGDVVILEWESANTYGEHRVVWRGVDKLTLKDGKIIEEVVYADTAPLQAMRRGERFEALIQMPA